MKTKTLNIFVLFCALTVMLSACNPSTDPIVGEIATPTQLVAVTEIAETAQLSSITQIVIDGKADDWDSYPVIATDESGDSLDGTYDIAEVRGFVNNKYLYIMVSTYEDGNFDHMIFGLGDNQGHRHTLNVWPGEFAQISHNQSGGTFEEINALSARNDVIEIKVSIEDLGFRPSAIQIMETYCGSVANCDRGDMLEVWKLTNVAEDEPEKEVVENDSPKEEMITDDLSTITQIEIDGKADDWGAYEILVTDPDGDQIEGMMDFAAMSAFVNDQYLYILIKPNTQDILEQLLIGLGDTQGRNYRIEIFSNYETRVSPNGQPSYAITPEIVMNEALEIKIALSELGFIPNVVHNVENCCGENSARGDTMDGAPILVPNEREPNPKDETETIELKPQFSVANFRARGAYFDKSSIVAISEINWGTDGFLYVCDNEGDLVKISPEGEIFPLELWRDHQIFAFDGPRSMAFDEMGSLYAANHSQAVKVLPSGEVEVIPGVQAGPIGDIAFGPDGSLYFSERNPNGGVYRLSSLDATSAEKIAGVPFAEYMAFSDDGFLYVSQLNSGVSKIDLATNEVSQFVNATFDPAYIAIDKEGDIWVNDLWALAQYSPDGQRKSYRVKVGDDWRSGDQHGWHTSAGITFDLDGNLWVASFISAIWKLTPTDSGTADPDFIFQDFYEGMRITGLAFNADGNLYAYDENTENLYFYPSDGEKEIAYDFGNIVGPGRGPGAVAVSEDGTVYAGVAGKIYRFDKDFNPEEYASVNILNMVVGKDGALYATQGGHGAGIALVRIPEKNRVEDILNSVDGQPFGNEFASIARYGDEGFLLHDFGRQTTYFIDYDGNSRIFKANYGTPWIGYLNVSPTSDEIFFVDHADIKWISANGAEEVIYAVWTSGDATMMAISPDEKWIYFSPSGRIGRIPIVDFWWQ